MAHIYSLPRPSGPLPPGTATKFPATPVFSSMNTPGRFEASIMSLEVTGTIPPEISGTFFRIQPDARFPPGTSPIHLENPHANNPIQYLHPASDIHFNGDGAVTAIRLHAGHADLQHRYVRTDRYRLETAARRALFGKYRNPYTDHPSVAGVIRTAANTNVVFWRGVLLALKEDGPPFALDPATLATLGRYDFEGQLRSPTFCAHPKVDPRTGEMVGFGYEAGGDGSDGSTEVGVWGFGADGRLGWEAWYRAPFAGMVHDCGLSRGWVVLPLTPLKVDVERMRRGGEKFAWDAGEDQWYGLVPRGNGKREDIIWFRGDNGFHGHVAGCYELPSGKVVLDLTVADGNVFFFFPPDNGDKTSASEGMAKRNKLNSPTMRWVFDPKAKKSPVEYAEGTVWVADERVKPTIQWKTNGEFSRIDDRYVTKPYRHFWQAVVDTTKPYDFAKCGPPVGGLFNCLGHYTWAEEHVHADSEPSEEPGEEEGSFGLEDVFFFGPTTTFQEPTFIPKEGGGEGEGYLIALLNHLDQLRNDVVIFDALNLSRGPLAVIHLPFKLKLGLHGNWVDNREMDEWKKRRAEGGDLGPVQPATDMLPWQKAFFEKREAEKAAKDATADKP